MTEAIFDVDLVRDLPDAASLAAAHFSAAEMVFWRSLLSMIAAAALVWRAGMRIRTSRIGMHAHRGVSGFVSLALEVLWTRMLAEGTGSSIYIFTTILAIFLLGIAVGSFLYRRFSRPGGERLGTLGLCLAGVGVLAQAGGGHQTRHLGDA